MANKKILLTNLGGGGTPLIEDLASGALPLGSHVERINDTEVRLSITADSARRKLYVDCSIDPEIIVTDTFADEDGRVQSGDTARYREYVPGEEVFSWLAAGEKAELDDPLGLNGDGTLQVVAFTDDRVQGYAAAAVDNSVPAVPARVKVRIA